MKIIAEPVEPVTKYRKSVPPNVAAAVAKALEKLPADRFESAKAFADALAQSAFRVATPQRTRPRSAPAEIHGSSTVWPPALSVGARRAGSGITAWNMRRPAPEATVTRSQIVLFGNRFSGFRQGFC